MPRKKTLTFNDGLEAAAKLHKDAAAQYNRAHHNIDAMRHKQWAYNILKLKEPEGDGTCTHSKGYVACVEDEAKFICPDCDYTD